MNRETYQKAMEVEFRYVLTTIGRELFRWIVRKEFNPSSVAELANIEAHRFQGILDGAVLDVTLKEISDIGFHIGLELKYNITKA